MLAVSGEPASNPAGAYGVLLPCVFPALPRCSSYPFTLHPPGLQPLCQQALLPPSGHELGLTCVLGPMGVREPPGVLISVPGIYFQVLRVILQECYLPIFSVSPPLPETLSPHLRL